MCQIRTDTIFWGRRFYHPLQLSRTPDFQNSSKLATMVTVRLLFWLPAVLESEPTIQTWDACQARGSTYSGTVGCPRYLGLIRRAMLVQEEGRAPREQGLQHPTSKPGLWWGKNLPSLLNLRRHNYLSPRTVQAWHYRGARNLSYNQIS